MVNPAANSQSRHPGPRNGGPGINKDSNLPKKESLDTVKNHQTSIIADLAEPNRQQQQQQRKQQPQQQQQQQRVGPISAFPKYGFLPPPNTIPVQHPYMLPLVPNPYFTKGKSTSSGIMENGRSAKPAQEKAYRAMTSGVYPYGFIQQLHLQPRKPVMDGTNPIPYGYPTGVVSNPVTTNATTNTTNAVTTTATTSITVPSSSSSSTASQTPSRNSVPTTYQLTMSGSNHSGKSQSTENDYKPFKCSICSWAFSRHSDLRRHLRSHGTPEYRCPYWDPQFATCPHHNQGRFNRLDVLKRHLRLVHYEPLEHHAETLVRRQDEGHCLACGKLFANSRLFLDHADHCARTTPMERWKYRKNGVITSVKREVFSLPGYPTAGEGLASTNHSTEKSGSSEISVNDNSHEKHQNNNKVVKHSLDLDGSLTEPHKKSKNAGSEQIED